MIAAARWDLIGDLIFAFTRDRDVATAYGITNERATQIRNDYGLPPYDPESHEPKGVNWAGLREVDWASFSNRDLADMFGCSTQNVIQQRARHAPKRRKFDVPASRAADSPPLLQTPEDWNRGRP